MKRLVKLFSLCLLALLIQAAHAQEENTVVIPTGDTLKIGIATDLSNILPAPGLDIAQAAQLAVMQKNADGGILGFQVEIVLEDDLCTREGAVLVAEEFVAAGDILAVVGHVCSGASIPASELYEAARIPMVSASSTAGAFTDRGLAVTNRTAFNDNIQGTVAARFIHQVLRARQIVVLHNETSYGEGLAETVAETFSEELGGTVLLYAGVDIEAIDFTDLIADLVELNPDLVYYGGYDDGASLLVEQMRLNGLTDAYFFSDDGVFNQDFLDFAGDYAEGSYVTFGTQEGAPHLNSQFDRAYEEEFGVRPDELGPFHAQAYDAAQLILLAIENIAELDASDSLVIDREALISAIRQTQGYEGLSGTITCDAFGDCGTAEISVYIASGGAWVKVGVPPTLQVNR